MDDNRLRFGVGVLVIAAIGVGIILTFLFGAFPSVLNREYYLHVWFPSAEGISTNTPVLRDGVRIGRVSDIQLVRDFNKFPDGGVVLSMAMDADQSLNHDYVPRIGIGSLITGDSKLEFVRVSRGELVRIVNGQADVIDDLYDKPYNDGDYINYGSKVADPFSVIFGLEDDVKGTMNSIRGAGEAIQEAGRSVKTLVGDIRGVIGIEPPGGEAAIRRHEPLSRFQYGNDPQWVGAHGDGPHGLSSAQLPSPRLRQVSHQQSLTAIQDPGLFQDADGGVRVAPRNEATVRELTAQAIDTLAEFQAAIRDVRQIVSDPEIRGNLERTLQRVPEFLDEAGVTLQATQRTFESFEGVGKQFEQVGVAAEKTVQNVDEAVKEARGAIRNLDGTFENIEAFTEPLGEQSEELVARVLSTLAGLEDTLYEVRVFGAALNQGDGTIRRLIEDDQLYDEVARTVQNIEMASAKLRPILDDVRVFTDKIARDPRQLGIRGAITQQPNGLGIK